MVIQHFTGIKGSGMSALAHIVKDMGYSVQGSDESTYYFTQKKLEEHNIPMMEFDERNIKEGMDVIVGNAYLKETKDNKEAYEEYEKAKKLGLKIHTYPEYLGKLTVDNRSIAVTGAHGKTTTTTMVSNIFKDSFVTSFLIGDGTGVGRENSDYFILEACEYRGNFLAYKPNFAVVTNIEFDHPDYFKDEQHVFDTFQKFVNQVEEAVVYCGDDRLAAKLTSEKARLISYGFNDGNEYQIKNMEAKGSYTSFDIYRKGKLFSNFKMAVFGLHEVLNVTSAIALADINNISPENIQKSLDKYEPAMRRFTEHKINDRLIVVDDYAHHHTEITATIDTARRKHSDKEVIAVFQPHTYTRTKEFLQEFAESLKKADRVLLCPIYASAREKDPGDIKIENLQELIPNAEILKDENDFYKLKTDNGIILFMGAGDINNLCHRFLEKNLIEYV